MDHTHSGYLVLIKAIHGGGGKGMHVVSNSSQFMDALGSTKRESLEAFGNDGVLAEKFIERPRHVEVQVFADTMGGVISLWEHDCSATAQSEDYRGGNPGKQVPILTFLHRHLFPASLLNYMQICWTKLLRPQELFTTSVPAR